MQSTTRPVSTRGLSALGILLLVIGGTGVAVLLYRGLSSISESRAAGSLALPDEPSEPAPEAPAAATLIPGTDGTPDEPAPKVTVVETAPSTTLAQQNLVAEASDKVEGPKLKHIKGGGKSTMGHEDIHAMQRERRREKADAAAQGITPESEAANAEKAKATLKNSDRWRLSNKSGGPSRSKGKKGE